MYSLLGGACLAVLVMTSATARGAGAEDLQQAIHSYNAGDYAHASDLLQNLDTAGLNDQQKAAHTDYLSRARQGVNMQLTPGHAPANAVAAGHGGGFARRQPVYRQPDISPVQAETSTYSGETFVRYPANWAEICRRQERYGALQRMEDRPTREARQKFAAIVREISFEPAVPFADAIDRIRRDSGLNLVVNWPALQQSGVTRDQEVALPPLTNIPWRKVTELLLQQVNAGLGGVAQLDWAIDGGILMISTRDDLDTHLSVRVYDVGDLLVPRLVVQNTGSLSLGGGTAGGMGGAATGGVSGGTTGGGFGSIPIGGSVGGTPAGRFGNGRSP